MPRHPRRKKRYAVQMPMTPLIDIVFMLLIYFLLTTNFMVDEGIKVKLPQAKAAAPQTQTTTASEIARWPTTARVKAMSSL